MTPPLAVAHATLATLDPALPGLVDVLDAPSAAGLLTGVARRRPVVADQAEALRVRRNGVQYRPGHSCVATWEQLAGRGDEGEPSAAGPAADVLVLEARPDGVHGRRFTADPALPGLAEAADPAAMRLRLAAVVGEQVLACSVAPVRYRAGSRCVLRYELTTRSGCRVLYGKVLRADVAALAGRLSALVARGLDDASLPALAPVLSAVPELGLVVQAEAAGRPLAVGNAQDDPSSLRCVGRQLSALHRTPSAGWPVRRPADDLAEVRDSLPAVLQAAPRLGARLARSLDRLAVDAPELGSCATHGALRTDQVRLDGQRLVLLDLDDLCAAPAERDLANLLAYLRWRVVRRPALSPLLSPARAALLDGYLEQGGQLDGAVHDWYERLSLLKIAARRYRRLDVGEWELVPRLLDEADTLAARRDAPLRVPPSPRQAPSPAVPPALDVERMTRLLTPMLSPWAEPGDRPAVVAAQVLAAKPGVRAVLRYEVTGLSVDRPPADAAGRSDAVVVLGKLYREPERAARLDRTLRLLGVLVGDGPDGPDGPDGRWQEPRCTPEQAARVRVRPYALGWLAEPPLAVYLPAVGDPLDELPAGLAATAASQVGRWLARLHAADVQLERQVDPAAEVRDAASWAAVVAARDPALGPGARQLAGLLADAPSAPEGPLVPLHKDLHHRHVLVRRGSAAGLLSVIDFDEARMGDAALDVAHLCANLDLLQESGRTRSAQWRAAFLDEYVHRTRWRPGTAFRFWYAHTCLKMAKQLATGRGPWGVQPDDDRLWLTSWALAAGREQLR